MNTKPLVRWTFGPHCEEGFHCLERSVKSWHEVFGDHFDCVICYNGLSPKQIRNLKSLQVPIIDQRQYTNSIKLPPWDTTWKLYPPRLRLGAHEVFIDNDLVVYSQLPTMTRFLDRDDLCICTQAHARFYGRYRSWAPSGKDINSGLFGLCPNFDLQTTIDRFLKLYPRLRWDDHCDDEGMLAFLFSKRPFELIPLKDIWACNPNAMFAPYGLGRFGTHFVSLNGGSSKYWRRYLAELEEETSPKIHDGKGRQARLDNTV